MTSFIKGFLCVYYCPASKELLEITKIRKRYLSDLKGLIRGKSRRVEGNIEVSILGKRTRKKYHQQPAGMQMNEQTSRIS